jgi:two-component SAPR family response regulator
MKLLFIDNKSMQNSIRIGLLEQMAHHDVYLTEKFEDAMIYYKTYKPELVLIDFSIDIGLSILKKILEIHPTQHIITISDSFDCSEILGCDFCTHNYMKKRVLKKKGIHDLLYLIENFSEMPCEFAHKFNEYVSDETSKKD